MDKKTAPRFWCFYLWWETPKIGRILRSVYADKWVRQMQLEERYRSRESLPHSPYDQEINSLQTKNRTKQNLAELFRQHPDSSVFGSLPGAGPHLAPALLVKFGDDQRRFPTPGSVQAPAGTCPVTDSSGKRKTIRFRRGCGREFRDIAQQWARCSVSQSAWAATYLQKVRARGFSENHACRCLANRWLAIACKLWQIRQPL
jgi:transposase